jgi:hypothetical protein
MRSGEPEHSPSAGITEDQVGIRVGTAALERNWITPEQLKEALARQAKEAAQAGRKPPPLGEVLVRTGALSKELLEVLLREEVEEKTRVKPAPSTRAASSKPAASPLAGFARYRLVREIGRSATGPVYEAVDTSLGRKVALKMLSGEGDSEEEERLLREAKVCARLPRHPHVAGVYESGIHEGRRYIVSEFVEGLRMDEWWKEKSPSLEDRVRVLRDISLGIHHAHQHEIIHRDLKPHHLMVDEHGICRVVSFSLAKLRRVEASPSLTQTGFVVGTPGYMSPEQAEGRKVDPRSDVYSLGVILYEILAGRLPFVGETAVEVLLQVVRGGVPPPSSVFRGAVDRTLEAICLRAMARKPAERPASAHAFAGELNAWLIRRESGGRLSPKVVAVGAGMLLAAAAILGVGLQRKADSDRVATGVRRLLEDGATALREGRLDDADASYSAVLQIVSDHADARAGRDQVNLRRSEKAKATTPPPKKPGEIVYEPGKERGLRRVVDPDGPGREDVRDGVPVVLTVPNRDGNLRLYFDVDDAWAAVVESAELEVESFAIQNGAWLEGEFDSTDKGAPYQGTFRSMPPLRPGLPGTWNRSRVILTNPRFGNRQSGGSDFRFTARHLAIRRVTLRPVEDSAVESIASSRFPEAKRVSEKWDRGLRGTYFDDPAFRTAVLRRADPEVSFSWNDRNGPAGLKDRFSVRWTGFIVIPRDGDYLIETLSDGGVRVQIGGVRCINEWVSHAKALSLVRVHLKAGAHDLQIEYFDEEDDSVIEVGVYEAREGKRWRLAPESFRHDPAGN